MGGGGGALRVNLKIGSFCVIKVYLLIILNNLFIGTSTPEPCEEIVNKLGSNPLVGDIIIVVGEVGYT